MCTYQTLYYHNEMGYIIRCLECENIQVAINNVALTFCQQILMGFSQGVQAIYKAMDDTSENSLRAIAIPLPCDGIKLLLSKAELHRLIQMMNAADTEMRSLELISLFKDQ